MLYSAPTARAGLLAMAAAQAGVDRITLVPLMRWLVTPSRLDAGVREVEGGSGIMCPIERAVERARADETFGVVLRRVLDADGRPTIRCRFTDPKTSEEAMVDDFFQSIGRDDDPPTALIVVMASYLLRRFEETAP